MVVELRKRSRKVASLVLATSVVLGANSFLPLVEKYVQASEQETTFVEENFDQVSGQALPDGWELIQGQAEVVDGQLELTSPSISSPSRVLIPVTEDTGDYVFEADMTFLSAVEDTRWASLMYRVQSEDYPYYQFAIRRGTTALNGLEFAIRNENNRWEVPEKTFYPEPFQFNKAYHLKVVVKDHRVQHFVNGQLVIDTDLATEWSKGDVGFQVSGATVQFDNVKLTSQSETLPPLEESSAFLPEEPETNIIHAPTVISPFETVEDVEKSSGVSSMILPIEASERGDLSVNETPVSEALQAMRGKVIPIFQIEDEKIVPALKDIIQNSNIQDFHIMSSDPKIVNEMKEAAPIARGAVEYTKNALNKHDLEQFALDIHRNNAKVAVIPQKLLTPDVIHYLHSRTISVWGIGGDNESDAHSLIHLGVDGIIAENENQTIQAFSQYPENTIVQRPIVAAHRGVPSLAPENTMAGYDLAYELGADMIETDLQRTKDGHLVIMHDYTVDRTTNGTGAVSSLTLEEIRQLDAGIKFGPEFEGEKVPTFREILQAYKGKDVVLLVELKATGIEEQVIEEIEQEGMTNQVLIQSFNLSSVVKSHELKPEIGVGYLFSSGVPSTTEGKLKNAQQMLNYASTVNATLNSSYGSLSKEFITYMRQRGMTSLHWTFRNEQALEKQLLDGLIGPITDYTQWLTDAPIRLETPIKTRNLKVGKSTTIQAKAFVHYREDKKDNIQTSLFVTGDEKSVEIEGNTIKALAPGEVNVFVTHSFTMLGKEWNLVAEPIEVTIR
ncbi:glycerophosphodiester phosphodiesterase family protein [Aquibacillus albus]|uniref:Glycerophosphoryl diester phosphodiesterase n=1 Tax=Aquibacillus albus TaxID=1168171 RepID=A0ABS2MW96_9BACI|nr:glycerophosphodiester phosphodiesterase family protein [Aquibacillus albus]MBM7570147.1 glycerophosphoryl diester phosphodiesterase [Aquibacillus albus]